MPGIVPDTFSRQEKQYLYDGHGRRVASNRLVNGSSVRRSIYGLDGKLLFVQDTGEAKRKEYIYLGSSLIAERSLPNTGAATPESLRYQHTDALGSPVAVRNESKVVVERTGYEPYGWTADRAARSGPGYTGHHEDAATGLVYMQQRYYDPMVGGFLSVDPVTAYGNGDVRYFNRYVYGFDNPYKFIDPDGRVSKELKRLGYEDIGDGYVVRLDKFDTDGEAKFEVHVYEDSAAFREAAADKDKGGLRKAEVNVLTKDGTWGKHGKGAEAPYLGKRGNEGLQKVVQRELSKRNFVVKGVDGRLRLSDFARRNLRGYGKFLGPAGILLEYTRSSIDRGCEINPTGELCD